VDEALRCLHTVAADRRVHWLALLSLCGAYLQGGLVNLVDFPGAMAEMRHFGLVPEAAFAVAVIVLELGAAALVLSGRWRWLGALALAGFTVAASFVANRFWQAPPEQAVQLATAFFEHLGLAGAFALVACRDLARGAAVPA
jgi:uncharacterized membrane protein YphA (DoxX/SURF4 family)